MSSSETEICMVISWRLFPSVKAYWFNRLLFQQTWRIELCSRLKTRYGCVRQRFHETQPTMTTSWSRSPLRHLRYSGDNDKRLQKLSNRCRYRCRCIFICLLLNDCRNLQCGCAGLLIPFTEVIGCVLLSRLCQFVELHHLLTKPLQALLHHFRHCAYHPAKFIIFAQLALLCLFIILIIPILPIVGTCKITQTVSDSNHHLLECLFRLSVRQSHIFSFPGIFLLLLNRCLCIFNLLSCPSGLSLNRILNPGFFVFIALEVRFASFLGRKLLFGSQAVHCPKGSHSLCIQAALAFIRLMTSLCGVLCRFTIFARRKWQNVLFRSIDHCCVPWLCCWARCWKLQDMGNMEGSFIFYVKVGTFTHLEQSKNALLTVNKMGIVTLTVHHDLIASVSSM